LTSTLPTAQKGHRFIELDSLRGLAAIAVVLTHFRGAVMLAPHPVFAVIAHALGGGAAAVNLFFLLSGFVLTIPYLGHHRPTYVTFLLKRICRIYLPYAAAILLAAFLAARLYSVIPTGNPWVDMTWSKPFSAGLLAQHLMMIGSYDNTRLNTAIWSLIFEMRLSLVFPMIVFLTQNIRSYLLVGSFIPLTYGLARLKSYSHHELFFDTLFCGLLFVSGSLLSLHYAQIQALISRLSKVQMTLLFCIGFFCYQTGDLLTFHHVGLPTELIGYLKAWVMAIGAGLILILATVWIPFRHLLHRPYLRWIGTRSYSIYLLHGTVLFTFIRLQHGSVLPLGMILPYIAITLLGAEAFYRAIELPALVLGRKLTSNTRLALSNKA
jgi:peptidoglycan/LPS O-acetylase OafA/YrhL